MRWHAFRAALRIARRDALRARGRSALVVAMVALPVLAVAAAAVLAATTTGTPAWRADSVLGTGAADALVDFTPGQPVLQAPDPQQGWMSAADGKDGATAEPATDAEPATAAEPPPPLTRAEQVARVRALLPAGSRVLTMDSGTARMQRADGGTTRAEVVELDYADPVGRGLVTQLSGRAPRTTDEVALTQPLARTAGLRIGDQLHLLEEKRALTVVGIVRKPRPWDARAAYTLPGAVLDALPPEAGDGPPQPHRFNPVFLVDTPTPLQWADVQRLNAKGALVTSRAVLLDPPADADVPYLAQAPHFGSLDAQSVAMLVVVVGMTLLEVVLLAGPAFAVGARQRRRQLALVAATGGSRGHVRDVVLAGGVVLGVTAGLVGAGLGVLAAWAARPLAERLAGHDYSPLVVPVGQVLGVAAVGALTAVLAAVVPAWQASRLDVVAALAGRRGQVRTPRRVPAVGALLAVLGGAGAAYGAWGHSAVEILAGSMVAEIGLVLCTPTLVGWAGRLAPYLPLSGRLALRDAARHRLRSAPAVAAVMAAVAGSVAIGSYLASQDRHQAFEYVPSALPGQVVVTEYGGRSSLDAAVRAVASVVPVTSRRPALSLALGCPGDGPCTVAQPWIPDENACPTGPGRAADDFRCQTVPNELFQRPPLVVAAADLPAVIGVSDPAAERVLRDGGVLVADRRLLHDGRVTLQLSDPATEAAPRFIDVPGAMQPSDGAVVARAIVSPGVVARTHAATAVQSVVLTPADPVSTDEQQRAEDAITALGTPDVQVTVERGYQSREGAGLLALAVAAGVVTLGAAAVATGLALADARPDLTTLAAVGASPGVRRRLAGSQAAVIAVLGTVLGVPAGLVPAAAVVWALGHAAGSGAVVDPLWRLAFPWQTVGVAALLVPVIAVLGTALLVRARLPVEQRAA